MKQSTKQPLRMALLGLSVGSMLGLPLIMTGCDRTESSTKTKSEKVVDTPEGTKKVTETTETKKTTDPK